MKYDVWRTNNACLRRVSLVLVGRTRVVRIISSVSIFYNHFWRHDGRYHVCAACGPACHLRLVPFVEKYYPLLHVSRTWCFTNQRCVVRFFSSCGTQVVTCPAKGCGKTSTTFDPAMYLSVPLPMVSEQRIEVGVGLQAPHRFLSSMPYAISNTVLSKG